MDDSIMFFGGRRSHQDKAVAIVLGSQMSGSVSIRPEGRFRQRFWLLKNDSGGSGSTFGSWEMVPTVPVSGSGSVCWATVYEDDNQV